ncbi:MAG TPA: tRNA uridine-5-carboxymethylaminomethyl(34) synthesis GTPase MnmE, partial [Pseudolabrys sp.]|nr:tRNA uridine-5-carboxymethylaminomethyl(34) synthesis GTPase MnmE [Pseudolabrys sp.]
NEQVFILSAKDGTGFDALLTALGKQAEAWLGGEPALVTRERHRQALESAVHALKRAASKDVASREDLVAEELRSAAHSLARLTGRVDVEDVLDVIFRDFCVGK